MDKLSALVAAALLHVAGLTAVLLMSAPQGQPVPEGGAEVAAPAAMRQVSLVRFAPPPAPAPPAPQPVETETIPLDAVSDTVLPEALEPRPEPVRPAPIPQEFELQPEPAAEPEIEPEPAPVEPVEPETLPETDTPPDPSATPVDGTTEPGPLQQTGPATTEAATDQPAATRGARSGREGRRAAREQRDYVRALMAALVEHRVYPPELMRAHVEGVVRVRFTIDRNGNVLSASLAETSGHDGLDQAALAVLERASSLPPIPDSMGLERLTITLPIEFSLITD
ncbi:energy transducer TonB [Maricaulis sp.]|uniref:energy transducer TonB n=1 Tax=Maricaulis sp. TaxID=1486257 RepID=UPI003A94A496